MKLSLSTNWCNRRMAHGEEIAEKALELGFDELELGFRTSPEQVPGFRAMLKRIPVGSIHAFCPVPVSAPAGHPELFLLASFAKAERDLARAHVANNIRFAADIGADTVVLHAGRVAFSSLFSVIDSARLRTVFAKGGNKVEDRAYAKLLAKAKRIRRARGRRLMASFRQSLEALVPLLEKSGVTLALENLPYLEGFPDESETAQLVEWFRDAPVRGWFDTGHHRVRTMHGWLEDQVAGWSDGLMGQSSDPPTIRPSDHPTIRPFFAGMHLNDVVDYTDDHLAPGEGNVDFAALRPLAESVRHVVFEPNGEVGEESLRKGLAHIRTLWNA